MLVAALLGAAFFLPATEFSTLATAIPALYLAFVGGHSWQQTKMASTIPPPPKKQVAGETEEGS